MTKRRRRLRQHRPLAPRQIPTIHWWQVDARHFAAQGRAFDLVTTHFLHPPEGEMLAVTRRLAAAVAPDGYLLIVGHAPPSEALVPPTDHRRKAMYVADQLLPGLPDAFEAVVVEQRPRTVTRDAKETIQRSRLHTPRAPSGLEAPTSGRTPLDRTRPPCPHVRTARPAPQPVDLRPSAANHRPAD